MTLTISENNKTALSKPAIDAMTQVYTDAVADASAVAVAADTVLGTAVKGASWTSGMTLKAHDDTLGTIKGAGWTNETIKANATAIALVDGKDTHLPMSATAIVKHPLLAVATYDFAVVGGAKGAINLTTNAVIPDNAIITHVVYDVVTDIASTSDTGTIKFNLPTDGDLTDALTAAAGSQVGLYEGKPGNITLDGNALTAANMAIAKAATYIKTTAARKIQATIETNDLTAGKINIYVWYVLGE